MSTEQLTEVAETQTTEETPAITDISIDELNDMSSEQLEGLLPSEEAVAEPIGEVAEPQAEAQVEESNPALAEAVAKHDALLKENEGLNNLVGKFTNEVGEMRQQLRMLTENQGGSRNVLEDVDPDEALTMKQLEALQNQQTQNFQRQEQANAADARKVREIVPDFDDLVDEMYVEYQNNPLTNNIPKHEFNSIISYSPIDASNYAAKVKANRRVVQLESDYKSEQEKRTALIKKIQSAKGVTRINGTAPKVASSADNQLGKTEISGMNQKDFDAYSKKILGY